MVNLSAFVRIKLLLFPGLVFGYFLLSYPPIIYAQEKPLDWYQVVRGLLTKGTTPETISFEARTNYITQSIRRRGVDFEMTDYRENFLRNTGAGNDLLILIRQSKKNTVKNPAPDSAEYFFLRGNACSDNDTNCKLNNYTKALQINPQFVDAYNNRGIVFLKRRETEMAFKDFAKAVEIAPNFAGTYLNRGSAYQDQNDHQQAIQDFNQAIEINPRFVVAYYNRGVSLAELEKPAQALADYNKAISLNPKYGDAYLNRGAIYGEMGNNAQAIKDFTSAIQINPADAMAYNNRGIIYERIGEMEKAQADYQKAQALETVINLN